MKKYKECEGCGGDIILHPEYLLTNPKKRLAICVSCNSREYVLDYAEQAATEYSYDNKVTPKVGYSYTHKNGNRYIVLALSNTSKLREDHPVDVFYVGGNGNLWTRPISDWGRSFSNEEKVGKLEMFWTLVKFTFKTILG